MLFLKSKVKARRKCSKIARELEPDYQPPAPKPRKSYKKPKEREMQNGQKSENSKI